MSVNDVLKLNESVLEAWNRHDTEKFLSLCDESIVWKDSASPEPTKGKQGAKDFFNKWVTAFPDFRIKQLSVVANEDTVAVEIEFSGTNTGTLAVSNEMPSIPATNKKITNYGTYFCRVKNGKFTHVHTYPDLAGMMMQLGLMQEMQA